MNIYDKIKNLGQVFTPESIVSQMLGLKKNNGNTLEPSCGNGAFLKHLNNAVGIEIDPIYKGKNILNIDFFDYSIEEKFDTIIGNPPYVKFQDIPEETKLKLEKYKSLFDKRSNLYLFFIYKSILHLKPHGELIFITPRDFLKATSSINLNTFIYNNGTITDLIDLGDNKIFGDYTPNCIIWRFEKDNFTRRTNTYKEFTLSNGQLLFTDNQYPVKFSDIFFVKVGAVSGADKIFSNDEYGNADFVCSFTAKTGKTKKMIFNKKIDYLNKFKETLMKRRIKKFDENNWWEWGRLHYQSQEKRIYVNCKTRNKEPFFLHPSNYYDGSVLAIFPKNQELDLKTLCDKLNKVNWFELGFVCDGRFIFSQRSLENCMLPEDFAIYKVKTKQRNLEY
ncbi:class I SAM-dependent methyltransferase [Oxyplasma meridianum]|uniref:site-specific DNA-methyltransferase (adenine-specific) n=1 Tax=Oxyplasma meridianum TaxID=3073602 RepID=A0AAX4NHI0_9ARCH